MLKPSDELPPIISFHGCEAPGVVTPWKSTLNPRRFICVFTRLKLPFVGTATPRIVHNSFVSKGAQSFRENSKRSLYVSLGHNTGWHCHFLRSFSCTPVQLCDTSLLPVQSVASMRCTVQFVLGRPPSSTLNRAVVH